MTLYQEQWLKDTRHERRHRAFIEANRLSSKKSSGRSLKVLVAEDDEGWRELLGFWLKQAGYEVTLCSDGLGVMPAARQDPPKASCSTST